MRITGGDIRGRRLAALKGLNIRPTSDKVREAVFDLLGRELIPANVLDLFAGTGSLGIEALSRGASWALFADHSLRSVELIRKNLRLCGFEKSGEIVKKNLTRPVNWKRFLKEKRFGLVFVDPPYGKGLIPPILDEITQREILAPSAIVVAEAFKTDELLTTAGTLQLIDERTYGETKITLYRFEEDK